MMRKTALLSMVFILIFAFGCSSTGKVTSSGADFDFIKDSYKVLQTAGITADSAMTALGIAYKNKKLSQENKDKAVEVFKEFQKEYDKAIDALAAYSVAPNDISKNKVKLSLTNVGLKVSLIVAINVL